MRLPRERMFALALLIAGTACSPPTGHAVQAAPGRDAAPSTDAGTGVERAGLAMVHAADAPAVGAPREAMNALPPDAIAMAGVLAAAAERCGLSTRAQAEAHYPATRARLVARGAGADEVDRLFWSAYDATLDKARQAGPAKARADCAQLRAMTDPKRIEALERAARDIRARAETAEAPAR